jgi:hypothetical protein
MTNQLPPNGPRSQLSFRSKKDRHWWGRSAAVAAAVLVLVGVGGGVGMAVTADNSPSDPIEAPPAAAAPATTALSGAPAMAMAVRGNNKIVGKNEPDPDRQAWAHKYGVDRATMANLADVASASPEEKAAAMDLLVRTEAATTQYNDLATAKAAGFDLQASLAKSEKKHPGEAARLQRADMAQETPDGKMPMLHVGNDANRKDGKVLDPNAPETLMYRYDGQGKWTLVGVMYTANESYPQAPPDPGGSITRWHYHDQSGGQKLMMHVFFVPGNDLAHAYAAEMSG